MSRALGVRVLEPWQWVLAGLGAFLVGVAKTGIAGLGVLSVAIFASVFPARESVGVVLLVLLWADFVAVAVYRREASWPHLARLFPWAGLGILLGSLTLGRIDDAGVRALIGAILVFLAAFQLWRRRSPPDEAAPSPHRALVIGTGLLAGFTTMIANAAGPIMVLYLLAMRLPKLTFVGTAAWFFLVINLFKVPFGYNLGLIDLDALGLSLRLAPLAVGGALSGRWLIHRINQHLFEVLALTLTLVAGLRLLLG